MRIAPWRGVFQARLRRPDTITPGRDSASESARNGARARARTTVREREEESGLAAVIRARRPVICGRAGLLIVTERPHGFYTSARRTTFCTQVV